MYSEGDDSDANLSKSKQAESPSLDVEYFNTDTAGLRRSTRTKRKVARFSYLLLSLLPVAMHTLSSTAHAYSSLRKSLKYKPRTSQQSIMFQEEMVRLNEDSTYNYLHPLSFAAQNGKNEVFTFREAMAQPDSDQFVEAMIKEAVF